MNSPLMQQQINHLQDMSGLWKPEEIKELQDVLTGEDYINSRAAKVIRKLAGIIFNPGGRFAPFNSLPIQTRSEETGLAYYATLDDAFKVAAEDNTIWKISFSIGNSRVRLVKTDVGWLYQPIKIHESQDEDFRRK